MAGRPEFSETEASVVKNICMRYGCVYVVNTERYGVKPHCGIKYPEEAVLDFQEPDGCQTAAIPTSKNPELRYDDIQVGPPLNATIITSNDSIIPGSMTRNGFAPFAEIKPLTEQEHQAKMTSERRPSGKAGGRVVFRR